MKGDAADNERVLRGDNGIDSTGTDGNVDREDYKA